MLVGNKMCFGCEQKGPHFAAHMYTDAETACNRNLSLDGKVTGGQSKHNPKLLWIELIQRPGSQREITCVQNLDARRELAVERSLGGGAASSSGLSC